MTPLALLLGAAILAVLCWRTRAVIRSETPRSRGTEPGRGVTTIRSHYASGLGGEIREYTVPKDPRAYARLFVPNSKSKG